MGQDLNDCGILVLSTDTYRDVWELFFKQFKRAWPHCSFPIYLGSNTCAEVSAENVTVLLSGEDLDWSTSFRNILEQVPQSMLLVLLEDLIIAEEVNEQAINSEFELMRVKDLHHIQITNNLKADYSCDSEHMYIAKQAPYRINVCGFWRRETLLRLLIDGETPWNFEIMGSYRSAYLDGFVRSTAHPLKLINLIEKGSILPTSVRQLKNYKIDLPPMDRSCIHGFFRVRSCLASIWFAVISKIPWRWRTRLMNFLRKILISY